MWEDFLLFVAVGLVAQMVDGAIGMAYGVTSTTVLLSFGITPATASACVHAAETFTTGASGSSHWKLGNVDRKLVLRLAVPGMIGGALGAYVLSNLPGDAIRPYVSAYLLVLGVVILWKAVHKPPDHGPPPGTVAPLGFIGGLLDPPWRRLGPDRDLDPHRAGGVPRFMIKLGQPGRVLRHADDLHNLPAHDRTRPVADHRQPRSGWRDRRAVRGLHRPSTCRTACS